MRLSVVIPAYNEAATITDVIARVRAATLPGIEREIVVADDGSTDGTGDRLAALPPRDDLRVVTLPANRGKSAALAAGFAASRGDVFVVQDADLEYDPRDHGRLLEPIVEGRADVVLGSRFLGGSSHRVLYFWHYVGNRLLTLLSNAATDLNLTDMECGLKAFRREVITSLTIESERFGFEPEIVAKVARGGWRIYEVSVAYHGRTYAEGKKIDWRDGYRAVGTIARHGLRRFQKTP